MLALCSATGIPARFKVTLTGDVAKHGPRGCVTAGEYGCVVPATTLRHWPVSCDVEMDSTGMLPSAAHAPVVVEQLALTKSASPTAPSFSSSGRKRCR